MTYHLIVSTNIDVVNTEPDKFCFKMMIWLTLSLRDFIFQSHLSSYGLVIFNHLHIFIICLLTGVIDFKWLMSLCCVSNKVLKLKILMEMHVFVHDYLWQLSSHLVKSQHYLSLTWK